jgi:Dolichyl-phosphate-mannose-protein mannosyltransferase
VVAAPAAQTGFVSPPLAAGVTPLVDEASSAAVAQPIELEPPLRPPSIFGQVREKLAPAIPKLPPAKLEGWRARVAEALDVRDDTLSMVLFGLSIVVYVLTRFAALDAFPIYFFSDEAVQTVLAADLVNNGFKDYLGHFLPTYFQNDRFFNLGLSVYLQVVPYMLFGKSIIVTRGIAALATVFGTVAVSLILKNIFKVRWWWMGVLLLTITPVWFLHSRTAFETTLMVSFYAWFLYFYLLYRYRSPSYLFPALVFGAMAFYSYSPGQVVVVATGLFLLISDIRYHWQNRRTGWFGIALLGLLILPYVRFSLQSPEGAYNHLRGLDSYWFSDMTLPEKIANFFNEYFGYGLSPAYWYYPNNNRDLVRHMMKDYGNILLATLPLAIIGILICLRRINSSAHRVLLIALLATPIGGSLVGVGATRCLSFVIAAALLSAVGLEGILGGLAKWTPVRVSTGLAILAFTIASITGLRMLQVSLVEGPTWFDDYDIGGMQYGAREVFAEIKTYLAESPETTIYLSPAWTNGASYLQRFFMDNEPRMDMRNIDGFISRKLELDRDLLFIMTPNEYQRVIDNPKFADIQLERTLPFPNGQPGFYFVRLAYSETAAQEFAAEAQERKKLVTEDLEIGGETVTISHSSTSSGRINDVFDGDTFTLARTDELNPAIIELNYPMPRNVSGLTVTVGSMALELKVEVFSANADEPVIHEQTYSDLPNDPTVEVTFEQPIASATKIRIEIKDVNAGDNGNVHVREITVH